MEGTTETPAPMAGAAQRFRGYIHGKLKDRVAGGDAASQREREDRIWRAPGERWFSPDDPIWDVHSDPAIFVGGIAALLLQSLHPLAMAGVMGHSGFRGDPWGRLNRTADHVAITTYAPVELAERQIRIVNAVHGRVSGVAPDGRPYAASDPHLLGWVHAAEAAAFLAAHETYAGPLPTPDADRYVDAMADIAARLGVLDPPRTAAGLEATITAYRPELEGTTDARDTAAFLLDTPPLTGAERLVYGRLAGAAVAVTPPWARAMLGREPSERQLQVDRAIGRRTVAVLRWAIDHPAHETPRPGRE